MHVGNARPAKTWMGHNRELAAHTHRHRLQPVPLTSLAGLFQGLVRLPPVQAVRRKDSKGNAAFVLPPKANVILAVDIQLLPPGMPLVELLLIPLMNTELNLSDGNLLPSLLLRILR